MVADKVRYSPEADFSGADTFTYEVCDTGIPVACATGTVNVEVTPVNDAPRARLDLVATDEDTPIAIDVLANDDAGPGESAQTITVTKVSDALLGTASVISSGPDAGKIRFGAGSGSTSGSAASCTRCATTAHRRSATPRW